jgi:hypothetical protein
MYPARMEPVEGARLTRVGTDIWVADRELILPIGIRLPIRMVVMRDCRRRLLCYSPVDLDPETLEALGGLGDVAWLAVPNRLHHTFLEPARRAFAGAQVIGCAGPAAGAVEALDEEGALDGFVDYRVVRASSRFAELVLYHDRSETLVVSDLICNVTAADAPVKWWFALNGAWGRPGQTRWQRCLHLRDRRSLAAFYRWAMARPFRQVSVGRGAMIRDGAREMVYRLFRRYLSRDAAALR